MPRGDEASPKDKRERLIDLEILCQYLFSGFRALSLALHLDPHAPAGAHDLPDRPLKALGIQVLHLGLRDLLELGPGDLSHRLPARGWRPLAYPSGFAGG